MYIIKRTDSWGGYVRPPGSLKSYCKDWSNAWIFPTREKAEAQICPGNEYVVEVALTSDGRMKERNH